MVPSVAVAFYPLGSVSVLKSKILKSYYHSMWEIGATLLAFRCMDYRPIAIELIEWKVILGSGK